MADGPLDAADAHWDAQRPKPRFPLVPFDQIRPTNTAAYLVKGLWPRAGLVVIYGPPKCGKSFLTFDICMHVALGHQYRGQRVRTAATVYIAAEGQSGQGARIEAWRRHHGHDGPAPFYLIPDRLDLAAEGAVLIADIRAQLGPIIPGVVVLDTLNRTLAGSERDDEVMGAYIKAADAIKAAFSCLVVIVHHSGIEAGRPRGHTSLTGAADCQIQVKRDQEGIITALVEWMKDGPEGFEAHSRLEVVEVGTDEDDEPITSCVIVPSDAGDKPLPRLSAGQGLALQQLENALIDIGKPRSGMEFPAGIPIVSLTEWRDRCRSAGLLEGDNEKTIQKRWLRIREDLQKKEIIRIYEQFVWMPRRGRQ
jgi:hypothetical protein